MKQRQCMTIKSFIQQHRQEIDQIVKQYYRVDITNDRARHEWLLNDEGLYVWAQREGVNI